MSTLRPFYSILPWVLLAGPAGAVDLVLPIDCRLGDDCFIQQYVDRAPGDGATDFTCGPLSYDTHKGTDFALPDLARMADGVDVLAAASGRVAAIRDGQADTGRDGATDGQECGNGLVIDHGDGWVTQYCHLKQGSLLVTPGQMVTSGQSVGQVGLSGLSEFPHLHFAVRRDDTVIDPFDTRPAGADCALEDTEALWSDPIAYVPGGLVGTGFADVAPGADDIRQGTRLEGNIPVDTDILTFWAEFYGVRAGDAVGLRIREPDNGILSETRVDILRNMARSWRFIGSRNMAPKLEKGTYIGEALLYRGGRVVARQSRQITCCE